MLSLRKIALQTISRQTLSEFEMEIRVRQVLDLAKQAPVHVAGNLGNGIILAIVFWGRLSHLAIAAWLGLFALFSAGALFQWWRKRTWPAPAAVSRQAIVKFTLTSFLAGLLWAAAIIYTFPNQDMNAQGMMAPERVMVLQLLIVFLVGGLSAGAVASMAPQPFACLAFVVPPVGATLILLALQPGDIHRAMLAMSLLYMGVIFLSLFSGFSSFVSIIDAKIASRSLQTRLLEIGLEESNRSNRAKSQFIANMSHELRTPLNAVIGFSEIIGNQTLGSAAIEQYSDYAKDIYQAGQHLLNIINDVLDISKIEAGKLKLSEEEVDIRYAINSATALINRSAADAGVTIELRLPQDIPPLFGDEMRLKQIFINLLSNAVKFSNRGGNVVIDGALDQDGQMRLWVCDTGIGMTEEEVAAAAEPFQQAESGFSRMHSGTGLGLSLVEGFMKLHGGSIEIESAPSAGTTVTLIFPAERVMASNLAG